MSDTAAPRNTTDATSTPPPDLSRREFIRKTGAAASTFAIVPRHVLGGKGHVPPSEKITLACIGFGTQAVREFGALLANPEVQVVAMCDVEKDGVNYLEWSKGEIRNTIRLLLENPTWREGYDYTPGGRDVGKEIVETYYAKQRGRKRYRGCATYADFRELLEKEKDVTAVKVMTPDHLHATVALAAMNKGMNVIMHKPLANRVLEARKVVETARATRLATHFLAASDGTRLQPVQDMIASGAIGTLREIHNWSSRPMWPQYATVPADRPPVPPGFDWSLWLGPSVDRPYHPHYTHTTFRGWYEFGGGSIADMGHYSLWPIFQWLELDAPTLVESTPTHVCAVKDTICQGIDNQYSFPTACTVRMRFPAKGARAALDIFWYDGGIRPATPEELIADNQELSDEGMLLVGDQGTILGEFHGDNPRLIPESKMKAYATSHPPAQEAAESRAARRAVNRNASWIAAFRGAAMSPGDFTLAGPISEAINLAAVSLRLGGRRLLWDASGATVTNIPEANKLLTREYRVGWEI